MKKADCDKVWRMIGKLLIWYERQSVGADSLDQGYPEFEDLVRVTVKKNPWLPHEYTTPGGMRKLFVDLRRAGMLGHVQKGVCGASPPGLFGG